MTILSFLAPVAAIAAQPEAKTNTIPSFKPRWWYRRNRLDGRPVAWSLRNRPDDWEWRTEPYTIRHMPSGHIFWASVGGWHLFGANCGCTSSGGRFQYFQSTFVLRPAMRAWRRRNVAERYHPEEFAAHFLPKE